MKEKKKGHFSLKVGNDFNGEVLKKKMAQKEGKQNTKNVERRKIYFY